jgi:hypothetical protein
MSRGYLRIAKGYCVIWDIFSMTALAVWGPPRVFIEIVMVGCMEQQIAAGRALVLWQLRILKVLL